MSKTIGVYIKFGGFKVNVKETSWKSSGYTEEVEGCCSMCCELNVHQIKWNNREYYGKKSIEFLSNCGLPSTTIEFREIDN